MKNTKARRVVCCIWIALLLAFIWGNSLCPAEVSASFSGAVLELIRKLIPGLFSGSGGTGHGTLRKIAHFFEFGMLGVALTWFWGMLKKHRLLPVCCAMAVAWIDEGIQIFVPGRGPAVRDVCIDTLGAALGVFLLNAAYHLRKKRKK